MAAFSRRNEKEKITKELGAGNFAATDDDEFVSKFVDTIDVSVETASSVSGFSFDKCLKMLRPRGQLYFITVLPAHEKSELFPFALL